MRVIEKYRRIPSAGALVISAIVAGVFAFLAAVAGAVASIYLYDRGMSKGNDLVVGTIGLCAVGTFVFVTVFTWFNKLHHAIGWRTPTLSLAFCLSVVLLMTGLMWKTDELDFNSYSDFVRVGWVVILCCGLLAFFVSSRFVTHPLAERERGV